jgi:hypothetical protein
LRVTNPSPYPLTLSLSPHPIPTLFNENHKARIRVTFEAIDEMLSRALAMLDPAGPRSPFSMHVSDATAEQFRRFGEEAARYRAAMQDFMTRHGIPLAEPKLSSVWAARSALLTAIVSLEELAPKSMRGYGSLSPDAARTLETEIKGLIGALGRMQSHLTDEATQQ